MTSCTSELLLGEKKDELIAQRREEDGGAAADLEGVLIRPRNEQKSTAELRHKRLNLQAGGDFTARSKMVWSREPEAERPPLSMILPRLYLGAESDVTQDRLASLGISYVLSVSRCSPQPSFLPCSRYLRIPIDDSLWDDLLPWIPQALHFIDSAMSSGASVLVHCAAGISRSPALAVAYIMYSLEMDLDHAYRFVKERRPSISPNFNFLGQLQHFQGALSQRTPGGDFFMQQRDSPLQPINNRAKDSQCSQNSSCEADGVTGDSYYKDSTQQRLSDGNEQQKLCTLDLSLCQKKTATSPSEPPKPAPKPTQLHLPSSSASLLEKRKSLTLSLTPLGTCPLPPDGSSQQSRDAPTPKTPSVHSRETEEHPEEGTHSNSGGILGGPSHSRGCRIELKEPKELKESGLLSPINFTLNKLLDWGERMLLGGLFAHPVRMGKPALPYKC